MTYLKPAEALVTTAVKATLDLLPLTPEDAAAARLALLYADAIDSSEDPEAALTKLGHRLLAVLIELGATPHSRGAKGVVVGGRLAGIRASRAG